MKSACQLLLKKTNQEIWRRGEKYARDGLVYGEHQGESSIEAMVSGTKDYVVNIKFAPNGISQDCDCPYFTGQGYICKHIVAVAIVWDELRGMPVPSSAEVGIGTVPPPLISRSEINAMHRKPLTVDLGKLRILPDVTALGGRGRPHAELPDVPKKLITQTDVPLSEKEIRACLTEIRSWSKRKTYDPYFCAGEMVAAFCELVRVVANRLPVSNKAEAVQILLRLQEFNREMVTELIDDSQANREFSETHLDDLRERILKATGRDDSDYELVHRLLQKFDRARGQYY